MEHLQFPVEFTPFTESDVTQKIGESLGCLGYDNAVPEGIYTVRLTSDSQRWATDAGSSGVECRPDAASGYFAYRDRNALRRAGTYGFHVGDG